MKVFIVEDEELAVKRIKKLIQELEPGAEILGSADSIKSSVEWLKENGQPDLIFMDIALADGQSFEIFKKTDIKCPVIFTTSYDEFAIQAFKVNSVDYLLKPIQKDELQNAFKKFHQISSAKQAAEPFVDINSLVREIQEKLQPKEYRKRFLVKNLGRLESIGVEEIHYFYSHDGLSFFKTADDKRLLIDYTMDELDKMLDPEVFFRINRAFYVAIPAIERIEDYFGNRLILKLKPVIDKEVLVSREKVTDFKKWMGK